MSNHVDLNGVLANVEAQIRAFHEATGAPGITGALYHRGARRLFHCGVAAIGGAPVNETTLFALGSVTKVFTATLLGAATVNGEAAPGDSLLPLLQVEGVTNSSLAPVTLAMLATHTSQLQDSQFKAATSHPSTRLFDDKAPSAALIGAWNGWSNACSSAPGTHWDYSNIGFVTLGFALVSVAGSAFAGYDDLLSQRITGPLGMASTVPGSRIASPASVAQGYVCTGGQLHPVKTRAADLYSTATDMLAWVEANLGVGPAVPEPISRALAYTHGNPDACGEPWFCAADNLNCAGKAHVLPFDMGLAWQISHQGSIWAKDGATSLGGGTAWVGLMPAAAGDPATQGSAIAIMTNLDGASPVELGFSILSGLK